MEVKDIKGRVAGGKRRKKIRDGEDINGAIKTSKSKHRESEL